MLVALLVWRWAARRRGAHDRSSPEDDNYTGAPFRLASVPRDTLETSRARHTCFRHPALQSSLSTQPETSPSGKAAIRRHAYVAAASPTTTIAPMAIGGASDFLQRGGEWEGDPDSGVVLHVHDRHSLGVEPPTPLPLPVHRRPALPPISVFPPLRARPRADEVKARGNEKRDAALAVGSLPDVEVNAVRGTEAREGPRAQGHLQMGMRVGIGVLHGVDSEAKPGEGPGGDGRGARTRRTVIESDGGVRLAGGPPGLSNDSDCTVVTTLPPPYHHYDS